MKKHLRAYALLDKTSNSHFPEKTEFAEIELSHQKRHISALQCLFDSAIMLMAGSNLETYTHIKQALEIKPNGRFWVASSTSKVLMNILQTTADHYLDCSTPMCRHEELAHVALSAPLTEIHKFLPGLSVSHFSKARQHAILYGPGFHIERPPKNDFVLTKQKLTSLLISLPILQ